MSSTSRKVSVQDRIRALNLQQKESGRGSSNTPPRQGRPSSWSIFQNSSPLRPAAELVAAVEDVAHLPAPAASRPTPHQASPLPSSDDQAQLFKAARVIQKSFNPDADMLRRTQHRAAAYSSDSSGRRAAPQPSSYGHQRPDGGGASIIEEPSRMQHAVNCDEGNSRVLLEGIGAKSSEEEIDASAALEFWRTKGITPRGPLSYREAKRKESKSRSKLASHEHLATSACSADVPSSPVVATKGRAGLLTAADASGFVPNIYEAGEANASDDGYNVGAHRLGLTAASENVITLETRIHQDETEAVPREEDNDEAKPPSPPDIIRTANTDSELDQHGVADAVEDVYDNDEGRDIRRQEPDEFAQEAQDVFRQEVQRDHAEELPDGDYGHEEQRVYGKEEVHANEHDDQSISRHGGQHDYVYELPDDDSGREKHDAREQEGGAFREKEGQYHYKKEQQESRGSDYIMQQELPDDDYGALSNTKTVPPEGRRKAQEVIPVKTNEGDHIGIALPSEESQSSDTGNEHSILTEMVPLKMDKEVLKPEESKKRHVRSLSANSLGGGPYRAYARRSRLRSPRVGVTATSPDHSTEIDGTQSVVSSMGAYSVSSQATSLSQSSTQVSSLSSRATRFLKDKKDKRKGVAVLAGCGGGSAAAGTALASRAPGVTATPEKPSEVFAKDVAHNILRDRASKARVKHRTQATSVSDVAAASPIYEPNRRGGSDKTNYLFDEPNKAVGKTGPQTIDLKPAIKPKMDPSLSSLIQGFGDPQRQPEDVDPPEASQSPGVPRSSSSYFESSYQQQPKKADAGTPRQFDRAASLDDHSSYSELKAKDLFDIGGGDKKTDVKMQPATSPHLETNTTLETNTDFSTFPRREGKSFDQGCQVFEAINPLIESAFNALSPSSSNPFFGTESRRTMSTAFCDDAPSDEDIAIEVEYVEQAEERSHAETDSIFSVSTRDMDSVV